MTNDVPTPRGVGTPEGILDERGPQRSIRTWTYVAVALVALGVFGSYLGARYDAAAANQREQRSFVANSQAIATSLRVSISRQQDLINSAESFFIGNPHATKAQFNAWGKTTRVLHRYASVIELGIISYVPRADLANFARAESIRQGAPFTLTPPGNRPYYCFATVGFARPGDIVIPKDYDVCDSPIGSPITDARNEGRSDVLPYTYNGVKVFGVETPFYSGGRTPTTVAGRDAAFLDVVGVLLTPGTILTSALVGHPNMAVALHYGSANSQIVFHSGAVAHVGRTARVGLHDGWSIQTAGVSGGVGIVHDGGALLFLFAGVALSLMLGALILLLGAGREKLSLLVRDRTSQLQFQALHDSLTGLPNRALIVDRIEQMLERNRRRGTQGAALFVDLDDFKNVNDSLGHEAGDHLLVLVAWRMKSTLRGADTIGRMGGDEFVVLIDGGADALAPETVAQRLLDVMRQPFVLKGALIPLYVSTSIGIAVGDRQSGSELLRDADVALYQAKNAGKNKFAFFNSKMADVSERRIALEFDLRSAIRDNQFRLVYQPIYRLEDLSVVGVEALLRWHHPSEGVICPDEFIPILERTGQIREVGSWVLRESCRQMTDWRARGFDLDVSVNVSARQFDDDVIVDQVREASRVGGCERSLIVEVTETALMLDVDATVRRLTMIKELGVRVAIDDFGTGYCSLAYLRKFPIDCIKIDQSFIASLTTSTHSAALVKTFIQLGRDLGVTTLAEGVETIEQMDILRASGVTEVQGYLFARPLDPLTLETQILESQRHQKPQTRPRSL